MSNKAKRTSIPRSRRRTPRLALLTAVILIAVAAGVVWLRRGSEEAAERSPRFGVDRAEVDLGYRRFESPARVVFTLTNAGNGPLRLREVPRVAAAAGC